MSCLVPSNMLSEGLLAPFGYKQCVPADCGFVYECDCAERLGGAVAAGPAYSQLGGCGTYS